MLTARRYRKDENCGLGNVYNGAPANRLTAAAIIFNRLRSGASSIDIFRKGSLIPFNLQSRFLRFLCVGAVSTGVSYCVYALLMFVGMNYATASFGALVAGILFSFKAQGTLVFGNADHRLLCRFALCWLAIYVVNVILIGKFISLGIDKFVAGLLPIPWTTVLSYSMQRFVVFGRSIPVGPSSPARPR